MRGETSSHSRTSKAPIKPQRALETTRTACFQNRRRTRSTIARSRAKSPANPKINHRGVFVSILEPRKNRPSPASSGLRVQCIYLRICL
ncbi:MAG: hypothetical protein C4327_01095 [Meiothermus sp.]